MNIAVCKTANVTHTENGFVLPTHSAPNVLMHAKSVCLWKV